MYAHEGFTKTNISVSRAHESEQNLEETYILKGLSHNSWFCQKK